MAEGLSIGDLVTALDDLLARGLLPEDRLLFVHAGTFSVWRHDTRIGTLHIEGTTLAYTPRDASSPRLMN